MKVVVFSDSHGNVMNMVDIVRSEQPDYLFHLGDLAQDTDDMQNFYPTLPVVCVSGNCDGWRGINMQQERLLDLGGKRLLLLHGHTVRVKEGLVDAERRARALSVDAILFGHTHVQYCDCADGLWMMNPGSVREGCYGIVELSAGGIGCQCKQMGQMKVGAL